MDYNDLKDIIEHENAFWNKKFQCELEQINKSNSRFSSYWWEDYYYQITSHFKIILGPRKDPKILEAGSGSGKASLLLGSNLDRTFLDISDAALKYARHLSDQYNCTNITYIKGNIFGMQLPSQTYDLTWNIGVIEHYPPDHAVDILSEMLRVTKRGGVVAVGVPNFKSGPILKARILKYHWLRFIPGYRLETERSYTEKQLLDIANRSIKKSQHEIALAHILLFGNPMPVETPKWILRSLGKLLNFALPKNKFLRFLIIELK